MENRKLFVNIAAIGVVALIVIGSGLYFYVAGLTGPLKGGENATSTATSTVIHTSSGDVTLSGSGYTIQTVGDSNKPTPPQIARPLTFSGTVSLEDRTALQTKANDLQEVLKQNPYDTTSWLTLANVRYQAGDYEGARQSWTFVTEIAPNLSVSYYNLGNLYRTNLKDYPKAERWYLKAVSLFPTDESGYRALFELYTQTSYRPSNTEAENILKRAIQYNPKNYDFQVMLARYYLEEGRKDDARAMFTAARDNAASQGNTDAAASIDQELNAI